MKNTEQILSEGILNKKGLPGEWKREINKYREQKDKVTQQLY